MDIASRKISNIFRPTRKMDGTKTSSKEPPVTKMFVSADGQWVAAANCFGDVYIFNLEVQRYASYQSIVRDHLNVLSCLVRYSLCPII